MQCRSKTAPQLGVSTCPPGSPQSHLAQIHAVRLAHFPSSQIIWEKGISIHHSRESNLFLLCGSLDAAPPGRFFPLLAETDGVEAAETHLALALISRVGEDPGPVQAIAIFACRYLQIQAAAAGMQPAFALRTAAEDSRCICLAKPYPRHPDYPGLYPLLSVYAGVQAETPYWRFMLIFQGVGRRREMRRCNS